MLRPELYIVTPHHLSKALCLPPRQYSRIQKLSAPLYPTCCPMSPAHTRVGWSGSTPYVVLGFEPKGIIRGASMLFATVPARVCVATLDWGTAYVQTTIVSKLFVGIPWDAIVGLVFCCLEPVRTITRQIIYPITRLKSSTENRRSYFGYHGWITHRLGELAQLRKRRMLNHSLLMMSLKLCFGPLDYSLTSHISA